MRAPATLAAIFLLLAACSRHVDQPGDAEPPPVPDTSSSTLSTPAPNANDAATGASAPQGGGVPPGNGTGDGTTRPPDVSAAEQLNQGPPQTSAH